LSPAGWLATWHGRVGVPFASFSAGICSSTTTHYLYSKARRFFFITSNDIAAHQFSALQPGSLSRNSAQIASLHCTHFTTLHLFPAHCFPWQRRLTLLHIDRIDMAGWAQRRRNMAFLGRLAGVMFCQDIGRRWRSSLGLLCALGNAFVCPCCCSASSLDRLDIPRYEHRALVASSLLLLSRLHCPRDMHLFSP